MKCSPCENSSTERINVLIIEKKGDRFVEKIYKREELDTYIWTNPTNKFDVDGDGVVTVSDAILVSEAINSGIVYNKHIKPDHFYDVNGDGKVDQLDVLEVLNNLVEQSLENINQIEYPWTNPVNRFDVNGDGRVDPLDALLILQALRTGIVYNKHIKPDHFYDVNGDGKIDQSDADAVLQHIGQSQNINPIEYPWTNPVNRFDVNGDGRVDPLDALLILQAIQMGVTYDKNVKPDYFYDVNGDGKIDQSDADAVLQHIGQSQNINQTSVSSNNVSQISTQSYDKFSSQPFSLQETCPLNFNLANVYVPPTNTGAIHIGQRANCIISREQYAQYKNSTILPFFSLLNDRTVNFTKNIDSDNLNEKGYLILPIIEVARNFGFAEEFDPPRFLVSGYGICKLHGVDGVGFITPTIFAGRFKLSFESDIGILTTDVVTIDNSGLIGVDGNSSAHSNQHLLIEYAKNIKNVIIQSFNNDQNWPNLSNDDISVYSLHPIWPYLNIEIYKYPKCGVKNVKLVLENTYIPISNVNRGSLNLDIVYDVITVRHPSHNFKPTLIPILNNGVIRYKVMKVSDIMSNIINNYYMSPDIDVNMKVTDALDLLNSTIGVDVFGSNEAFKIVMMDGVIYDETGYWPHRNIELPPTNKKIKDGDFIIYLSKNFRHTRESLYTSESRNRLINKNDNFELVEIDFSSCQISSPPRYLITTIQRNMSGNEISRITSERLTTNISQTPLLVFNNHSDICIEQHRNHIYDENNRHFIAATRLNGSENVIGNGYLPTKPTRTCWVHISPGILCDIRFRNNMDNVTRQLPPSSVDQSDCRFNGTQNLVQLYSGEAGPIGCPHKVDGTGNVLGHGSKGLARYLFYNSNFTINRAGGANSEVQTIVRSIVVPEGMIIKFFKITSARSLSPHLEPREDTNIEYGHETEPEFEIIGPKVIYVDSNNSWFVDVIPWVGLTPDGKPMNEMFPPSVRTLLRNLDIKDRFISDRNENVFFRIEEGWLTHLYVEISCTNPITPIITTPTTVITTTPTTTTTITTTPTTIVTTTVPTAPIATAPPITTITIIPIEPPVPPPLVSISSTLNLFTSNQFSLANQLSTDPFNFLEKCEFEKIDISLKYMSLPKAPVNIYASYMKYVVRDLINPTIRGIVLVPITEWTGLNRTFAKPPCSHWISNTIPPSYNQYTNIENGNIVNVSGVENFITPIMGIGGEPTEIKSRVPLYDDDVPGRIVSGDGRCTKTKSEPGYQKCILESVEILLLSARANNLEAIPPFTEKIFDQEFIYFEPGFCNNLDIIFAIDVSGSMGGVIDNIKSNIDDIISFVGAVSDQSTIGIVEYGHSKHSSGAPIRVLYPTDVSTAENISIIKDAVGTLRASGAREPHGAATTMAIEDLRSLIGNDRNKTIILITDEPFFAGDETLDELNSVAEYAKQNDISIIGVHVRDNSPNIFNFLINMAEISNGAAVQQIDGAISEPLIKLLTRYCMISGSTSVVGIENPNECDESTNTNSIQFTIELKRRQEQITHSFTGSILSSSTNNERNFVHHTVGDPFYWPYVAPDTSLLYGTRPNGVGNWLNYPPSSRQGVSMNEARWDGQPLPLDLVGGHGLLQCAPSSFVFIDGYINVTVPTFVYNSFGSAEILRCLPTVTINTTSNIQTKQTIKIEGASGGHYFFRNRATCEISEKVWWDSSDVEITRILQLMPGFGAGNVTAIGSHFDYEIRFSTTLGLIPGIEILSYPFLTCTDQEITVVEDPPYNYLKPKPRPSSLIPIEICAYCSYEEELYNLRTVGLNYNCVKNIKSVVCRVSKPSLSYSKYKYDNGNVINIDESYIPKPGDNIILIDNELGDHKKFTSKISRSVVN